MANLWGPIAQALSQMAVAAIQKRAIDGANEYAMKAFDNTEQAQAEQNAQQAMQDSQHAKIVEQGDSQSQRMMQAMNPQQNQDTGFTGAFNSSPQGQSVAKLMQDFANNNNPELVKQRQIQEKFDADKKIAPEQFAGNYWIGDKLTGNQEQDDALRNEYMQRSQMEDAQRRYASANNPNYMLRTDMGNGKQIVAKTPEEQRADLTRAQEYSAQANPSYTDFVSSMKKQRALAMKEMIRKYGVDAAKQAQSLIDEAYNEKIQGYGDKVSAAAWQQVQGSLYGKDGEGNVVRRDLADRNNRVNFLMNLQNYNNTQKRIGQSGFDMGIAKEILASDAVKDIKIDSGGNIVVLGQRMDGSVSPMGVIPKTLSPKDIQNEKHWQADYGLKREKFAFDQKKHADDLAYKYSRGSGSGGSGSSSKLRKWADTLQVGQESALAAIRSGAVFDDDENHSVEEFRQNCIKALESGELDDEDKAAVRQMMNETMGLYQKELDKRSD